jgi:RNA polymerase sigma factor (sigma-70 family)
LLVDSSNGAQFPTTRHSAIRAAASQDGAERDRAWSAIIRAYWNPAYKHVRVRWQAPRADAEDAIQSFFARAMEKDFFASFDRERARFRTFFRTCLDRHVANELKAENRQKRGGGAATLSLDFDCAEEELAKAGAAAWESPASCFDREWRRQIFGLALEELLAECAAKGKTNCFAIFQRYDLCDGPRPTYEQLALEFGIPVTTVTNQLAYARRTLRRLVLQQLEAVTCSDEELRDEASQLLGAKS